MKIFDSMKRHLLNILLGGISLAVLSSCGIINAAFTIKEETTFECASILLDDGTTLEGSVIMPHCYTEELSFKDAEGNKSKIPANTVNALKVWKEKYPDNVHILLYRDYLYWTKKNGEEVYKSRWMVPEAVGEHLIITTFTSDYVMNADGDLLIRGEDFYYIAYRNGETIGHNLGYGYKDNRNTRKQMKEAFLELLADDSDLCASIEAKEIEPNDFDTICAEYRPD